jgi:hypothetical protein
MSSWTACTLTCGSLIAMSLIAMGCGLDAQGLPSSNEDASPAGLDATLGGDTASGDARGSSPPPGDASVNDSSAQNDAAGDAPCNAWNCPGVGCVTDCALCPSLGLACVATRTCVSAACATCPDLVTYWVCPDGGTGGTGVCAPECADGGYAHCGCGSERDCAASNQVCTGGPSNGLCLRCGEQGSSDHTCKSGGCCNPGGMCTGSGGC